MLQRQPVNANWIPAWAMQSANCHKNATVKSCSDRSVCWYRFHRCAFRCVGHCALLGFSQFLRVCASLEMDLIWIFMGSCLFPVTIPTSTCLRCLGLVDLLWDGGIPHIFKNMDMYHSDILSIWLWDVFCTVCVSQKSLEICRFTSHAHCSSLLCKASHWGCLH